MPQDSQEPRPHPPHTKIPDAGSAEAIEYYDRYAHEASALLFGPVQAAIMIEVLHHCEDPHTGVITEEDIFANWTETQRARHYRSLIGTPEVLSDAIAIIKASETGIPPTKEGENPGMICRAYLAQQLLIEIRKRFLNEFLSHT